MQPTTSVTSNQATMAGIGAQKAASNKDLFLKLLVAQMKYQDPLNPQDPTKMATQLSQFNMVEQQIETNTLLASLNLLQQANISDPASAASFLGHTVLINSNQIHYDGSAQDFTIKLDQNGTGIEVNIVDDNGNTIRHIQAGDLQAGNNNQTWDGKTDSGADAPQGNYHVEITASNSSGQDIQASIMTSGVVDAVRMTASGMMLVVNGIEISLADVAEIKA